MYEQNDAPGQGGRQVNDYPPIIHGRPVPFRRGFPCPLCGGHAQMPKGRGVRCWGQMFPDGWIWCFRVPSRWQNPDGSYRHPPDGDRPAAPILLDPVDDSAGEAKRRAALEALTSAALPADHPEAGPLRAYLAGRGLTGEIPATLLYHPALRYYDGRELLGTFPAMLALVESEEERPVTVHRTYLTRAGAKAPVPAPKKLMPPAVRGATRGAAIRLAEPGHRLALAEGAESGIAYQQLTNWATWACVSAGGLVAVEIPEWVLEVAIAADHDEAGLRAANALARRLLTERPGLIVRIHTPPTPGHDWADVAAQAMHQEKRA